MVSVLSCLLCNTHAWAIYYKNGDITETNDLREAPQQRMNLIFPGTKWCGSGSIAANQSDLGKFSETDSCCRTHDMCPDVIETGQSKHGLTNPSFYTRLDCSCDEKFYDCLHRSEDGAGTSVGFFYFNVLDTQCFREDYPIVGCKRATVYPRRCLEYELDESQPKRYQWFDVPPYK
ncbi:hypothetical protein KM043_008094 [Ampulex compressa]|nr:hypothetical protein KM043_008094 [Ampulex compressa]